MSKYFDRVPDDLLLITLSNIPILNYYQLLQVNTRLRNLTLNSILININKDKINYLVEKNQINLLQFLDKLGRFDPIVDLNCITYYCKDYQLLQWLHNEKKAKIDEKTFRQSLHLKNINIIKYLIEHNCQWPDDIFAILRTYDTRNINLSEIYRLVYSHQPCPFSEEKLREVLYQNKIIGPIVCPQV